MGYFNFFFEMGCCDSKDTDEKDEVAQLATDDNRTVVTAVEEPKKEPKKVSTPKVESKESVPAADPRPHGRQRSLSAKRHNSGKSSPKGRKSSQTEKVKAVDKELSLPKVFDQYAGEGDDADIMAEDNLLKFFEDIGVNPTTEVDIVWGFSWLIKAESLGEISRDEFSKLNSVKIGYQTYYSKNWNDIKNLITNLRKALDNKKQFEEYYKWLFNYFLWTEEGQKTLRTDEALEYWPFVLRRWKNCDKFITYTQKAVEDKDLRAVSNDLWSCVWEFARDVRPDLSNWEQHNHGGWPSHIDGFVEYLEENK